MQYSKKPYRHKHNIDNLAGILNISEEKKEDLKKLIFKSNINSAWKTSIEDVYKDAAESVLKNTNSVAYFKDKETGDKTFVVYVANSLIYSDLDSKQEFIKLSLQGQGFTIDKFKIYISKFEMAKRFPFREKN
mgnify:CR=1 FL=1